MGQRDLLTSMTMDQDFPGKVLHCRHVFLYLAQWSVQEDETIMGKVSKGKTRVKKSKSGKCENQDNEESTNSLRNTLTLLLK